MKPLKAAGNFEDFELTPAGSQAAVCVKVIDLGTQRDDFGDEVKWRGKIYLAFELAKRNKQGKPFIAGAAYTYSLDQRGKLRPVVEALLHGIPEEVQPEDLLGKTALVNIKHTKGTNSKGEERTYANLAGVMELPEGMPAPKPSTPLLTFDIDAPEVPEEFKHLPRVYGETVYDLINASKERSGQAPARPAQSAPASGKADPTAAAAAERARQAVEDGAARTQIPGQLLRNEALRLFRERYGADEAGNSADSYDPVPQGEEDEIPF